ncbi:MAG: hypothetical protein K6A65_04870 [Succinivibrionaceae bacterium]|nr:hypothetical protein [Succinivibrionaceae bacterium]
MRQNTTSARGTLPFQCFHTCAAPGSNLSSKTLFVRGVEPQCLGVELVSFPEHEPLFTPMECTGERHGIYRFDATMGVDLGSNLQRYCFKVALLRKGSVADVVWYSSLGMSRECPLLQHCFAFELRNSHPEWAFDLIAYQVVPDRFASSSGHFTIDATACPADRPIDPSMLEYKDLGTLHCGGDLDGIVDMIPYLSGLGCNGITLTPIFKSPSPLKEDTEDYDLVDPRLGGNGALRRLRTATLGYGMTFVLSGSFAYTGDSHPWFDRQDRTQKGAFHHPDSPYRGHYTFHTTPEGSTEAAYFHHNPQLPRLDYASEQVRHAIYGGENSVIRKWLRAPYGADGWCLDGGPKIGDGGQGRGNRRRLRDMCAAAREVQPECLMLAKFTSDDRYALNSSHGVDGAVNYTGFLSPIRAFFLGRNLRGESTPYTGEDLRRACENFAVGLTQQAKLCLINELDNQDLPRFYTELGGDKALYKAALALVYTWRGIPSLYMGDELGDVIMEHQIGPSTPLPFVAMRDHHASPYSARLQRMLHDLAALRKQNPALSRGTQIFIAAGGAHFAFLRIYDKSFALVLTNAGRSQVRIEQGSMLLPLFCALYVDKGEVRAGQGAPGGADLLIPLSGRNVRRVDLGEGLEPFYEALGQESLRLECFGAAEWDEAARGAFLGELLGGQSITVPPRSTVVLGGGRA